MRSEKLPILCQIFRAGFESVSATKMVEGRSNSLCQNVATRELLRRISQNESMDDVLTVLTGRFGLNDRNWTTEIERSKSDTKEKNQNENVKTGEANG